MAVMNPQFKPMPRPPQPVEPENPVWVAMFYQWLIDVISHQWQCLDETKARVEDAIGMIHANALAASDSDASLKERIDNHRKFHDQIEAQEQADIAAENARAGVWRFQGEVASRAFNLATDGVVLAAVISLLKLIGVL